MARFIVMLSVTVAMALPAMLAGCAVKGKKTSPGASQPRATVVEGIWLATATSMRIYPGSRFIADNQHISLEARIELTDEMDDSIKGAGRFHLDLTDKSRQGRPTSDMRFYTWDVPLLTLAQQQRFYDKVTRTYLFRLKMDEQLLPPGDTILKVTFTQARGETLTAQAAIRAGE